MRRKLFGLLAVGAVVLMGWNSPAQAVYDGTAKSFGGVTWYILNDYGVTQTELSGGELHFRNTTAGSGAAIWLNAGAADNLTNNKAFFETMRTSSYSPLDTTPWFRWKLRMNYAMGTSQNDMTVNGPGGTASSVASGTLPYEPPAFGGDRMSIGAQFERAYSIHVKGTSGGPATEYAAYNAGANTAWPAYAFSVDNVNRGGMGGSYEVSSGDVVTITIGKRPNGTLDVWWQGPQIKGSPNPSHFVNTYSTDNPDWFFYQIEIRARGGTGTPINSVQDLLLFQWGNDWDSSGNGPQSELPEPASLGLLAIGGLLMLRRRHA